MATCVFRTNPLKCVPMSVPMMKCGVPMDMRMCALDPFKMAEKLLSSWAHMAGKSLEHRAT